MSLGPSLLASLAALAITLALMLGLALLLRRVNPSALATLRRGNRLARIESLPLTPTHTAHLIALDGEEQVIVTGPHGATVLPTNKKTRR